MCSQHCSIEKKHGTWLIQMAHKFEVSEMWVFRRHLGFLIGKKKINKEVLEQFKFKKMQTIKIRRTGNSVTSKDAEGKIAGKGAKEHRRCKWTDNIKI